MVDSRGAEKREGKQTQTMNSNRSEDHSGDPRSRQEEQALQTNGTGAASALERFKVDHALRQKRQHGDRSGGPGRDEERERGH